MGKYIVKSGQNLFDVALTIYGSIEGVFDLLVSNEGQSLSFDTLLSPGQVLEYSDDYMIFKNVHDWFSDNSTKVANGDHIFEYSDVKEIIQNYISEYNKSVIMSANELYSNVWDLESDAPSGNSQADATQFASYINKNYFGFGASAIEKYANSTLGLEISSSSTDQEKYFESSLAKKRMVIVQNGYLSTIKQKLSGKSVILVDWGDFSSQTISLDNSRELTFEHCYDDDGKHIISLYGNFVFDKLDLSDVGGVYYPTSNIKVKKKFSSKLIDNEQINKLIILENEQDT